MLRQQLLRRLWLWVVVVCGGWLTDEWMIWTEPAVSLGAVSGCVCCPLLVLDVTS